MFYLTYAGYEVKKWLRDSLTSFMLMYPLLVGLVVRFVIPIAGERTGADLSAYYHIILAGLAMLVPRISGAVAAFSILDDRDDNILLSVKVAPLSLEFFIGLKLLLVYLFGLAGTAFALWVSGLVSLPWQVIMTISLLSSLSSPLTALLINVLAKNKVEGFAAVKGLNALTIAPIASLFFTGGRELLFAWEPGFWPAKAVSAAVAGEAAVYLNYSLYLAIGLAYVLVANALAYSAFRKRVR